MRYAPKRLANGVVIPGGLDQRPRNTPLPLDASKGPYRAIVTNVYSSVDPQSFRRKSIECDLITVKGNVAIYHATVMQKNHGLNSADLWFPRPSSKTVSGAPLDTDTLYGDYDGDIVLVDFIEGESDFPVVLGALPHEQSKRKPIPGPGWTEPTISTTRGVPMFEEHYTHHRGTEIRINQLGDVLIDTAGAYGADDLAENSALGAGQIRLNLKDLQRFTVASGGSDIFEVYRGVDGQLHIDLGEGATEPIPLGNVLKSVLTALTVGTAFGPSSTPLNASSFSTFLSLLNKTK